MSDAPKETLAPVRRWHRGTIGCILLLHTLALAYGGWCHSPTWDEAGHLPSGISHWRTGRFHLYRVNPPLVRMVAALPVLFAGADESWLGQVAEDVEDRGEWTAGAEFCRRNGEATFFLFALARWACIPFSLLGATVCYLWARDLYGPPSGLLALVLWCACPNILAHGQMVTPDVGATALGVAAFYCFWRWLAAPTVVATTCLGVLAGLLLLTKFTWIIVAVVWPASWLVQQLTTPRLRGSLRAWSSGVGKLAAAAALALWIVHLGYGFEGAGQRLGDIPFRSVSLGGYPSPDDDPTVVENRFGGTPLAGVAVPVPANYALGIDRQKVDFERGYWSYLRGEWRHGGWWYYYLYALAVKVPLGTWLLLVLAAGVSVQSSRYRASLGSELYLLTPCVVILVLVSGQTGFNHHLRYVLPVFPFAFIWMSKVARSVEFEGRAVRFKDRVVGGLMLAAVAWSCGSSLYRYPHSLSYFNEAVGGPRFGQYHLLDSNIDWGQDLLMLKWWMDRHPDQRPMSIAYSLPEWLVDPAALGLETSGPPPVGVSAASPSDPVVGPWPGRYAVFVREMYERDGRYAYFRQFEPVGYVGYTVYLYDISLEDANRVRRSTGLPRLTPEDVAEREWAELLMDEAPAVGP